MAPATLRSANARTANPPYQCLEKYGVVWAVAIYYGRTKSRTSAVFVRPYRPKARKEGGL